MDTHLAQATAAGIDVLWWTEHDFRMEQFQYRNVVHFDSLTSEATDGPRWVWQPHTTGALASYSGGIVSNPRSPNDTEGSGALSVAATARLGGTGSYGFSPASSGGGLDFHGNVYGQTLSIDVLSPVTNVSDSYLELRVGSSWHTAIAGRPAGYYALSYRFGGPDTPGIRRTEGTTGVVPVAVVPGVWTTVLLTPSDDVAALWPEMQADDFATFALSLSAVSGGSAVSGYFDYLRFTRQYTSGDLPLQRQQAMMSAYSAPYPSVTQLQGLEISLLNPHINWFGPAVHLPELGLVTAANYSDFVASQVGTIHGSGGAASYNHPFGSQGGALQSTATQDAAVVSAAGALLANGLLGCDILEVGFTQRAGKDLAHHVMLWDVLSANALFVTGNGTSDDHAGVKWLGTANNWFTSVWAGSSSMTDLTSALASGRAWTASLSKFRGSLDLMADGSCPMGSVSLSSAASRQVTAVATGLPAGSKVEIVRGAVDYAKTKSARAVVVASVASSSFAAGSTTVTVDTGTECYVRTQVRNSLGTVIALSNPVWLLHSAPAGGIPALRAA